MTAGSLVEQWAALLLTAALQIRGGRSVLEQS